MNIAVLASGNGSNFEAIVKAFKKKPSKVICVKLLIVDNENAYARARAKKLKVNNVFIDPKKFKSKKDFEKAIIKNLRQEKIGLVVLAGYMRILSPYFLKEFKNKILNIHPALLPAFKGGNSIVDAFKHGVKATGVTVHFVDEKVDHGPIISQVAVKIKETDTLATLKKRIHKVEHSLYPEAINLFCQGRLSIKGRVVKLKKTK